MNQIAISCTALLGLLLFGLGFAVSMCRAKTSILCGFPDDPASRLTKMVRAHGNTAEFVPYFSLLFLYLGAHNPAGAVVWLIVAATVCRFLIVFGILSCATLAKPNPFRFVGALGTYVCGVALTLCLFI